jgi:hypothetical protein
MQLFHVDLAEQSQPVMPKLPAERFNRDNAHTLGCAPFSGLIGYHDHLEVADVVFEGEEAFDVAPADVRRRLHFDADNTIRRDIDDEIDLELRE